MSRRVSIALAVVLVSVLLSPLQRELFVGDETKYTQVVREMREGSFFVPTLGGTPFTHKPPLHFWAVDLLTYVFGVFSIWPFVLPSLVSFGLLAWLMWRMGGPVAAFVCATALLMWGSAQTARMDVAFAALLALAAWMVRRFFEGERTLVVAALAAGLAFLVKGPMAPVIIIALFAFEALRLRRIPRGNYAAAIGVLLGVPLLWLGPAILIGGEPFWQEIFFKQTVGRAVGAWVHRSPPWFYVVRAPVTLMPWFFVTLVAVVAAYRRRDEEGKFAVSWILAVLVPYTLLSSKLDVYMITMIPAVALVVARLTAREDHFATWGRRANMVMLALLAVVAIAGLVVQPDQIRGEDAELIAQVDVRMLFVILLVAAIMAMVVSIRGRLVASVIATGLVLVVTLSYVTVVLIPLANEMASTRPLVRALERQDVPPERIGLFVVPHVWVRGMRPELDRMQHLDVEEVRETRPEVLVVRRRDADELEDVLPAYRKVDELRMIGKWFDVYRR